jgi:hypothetical protein
MTQKFVGSDNIVIFMAFPLDVIHCLSSIILNFEHMQGIISKKNILLVFLSQLNCAQIVAINIESCHKICISQISIKLIQSKVRFDCY